MSFEREVSEFSEKAVNAMNIAIKQGRDPFIYGEMADLIKVSALTTFVEKIRATIGTDGTRTFEEENARRQIAKEYPFFFRYEDGSLGACDSIPIEGLGTRKKVSDENIVELYFENLSPEEIAKKLDRPLKRIYKGLKKFGIYPENSDQKKFQKSDIPYGWTESNGKLIPDDDEQWVLRKISDELTIGKKAGEIVTLLKKLGIKPRGGIWHEERISQVYKLNKRLLSAYGKNQSGWKELSSTEAGKNVD